MEAEDQIIAVFGLGYIGLSLATTFAEVGFQVLGYDTNKKLVEKLQSGKSHILSVPDERLQQALSTGHLEVISSLEGAKKATAYLIAVPTPVDKHQVPSLAHVETAARTIATILDKGDICILESTTYPGTTEGLVLDILERSSGLVAGQDFHLAFSPEREDPGNSRFSTAMIPKVVGGLDARSLRRASALYASAFKEVVEVKDIRTAEAAKLTENIFRATNIALVNELKIIFDRLDIDIWSVLDASDTKPFGFMRFNPGPGIGGHCIPVDPFYLTWRAKEVGLHTRFIELAGQINALMPKFVVQKTQDALGKYFSKSLHGARVLVLGLAYKPNVPDFRESPAIAICKELEAYDCQWFWHDPLLSPADIDDVLDWPAHFERDLSRIRDFDVVLIVTDHDAIDWVKVSSQSKMVVDTRNRLTGENTAIVIKA